MKLKPFVRNPYNYDVDEASDETGLKCTDESRTEQQHIEEADINYIAERFMRTGEMNTLLNMPTQGDFQGIFDFQTAMNTIVHAKNEFMKLPAKTRTRFNNDPAELIQFLEDPTNRDEAVKLGFIAKPATTTETTYGPETYGNPQEKTQSRTGTGRTKAGEIPPLEPKTTGPKDGETR